MLFFSHIRREKVVNKKNSVAKEEPPALSDLDDLKPTPPPKLAPRGIRAFTVFRKSDETGVSGDGIVIEGVELATGQCIIHWLYPPPKGGIAIFESMEDFIKVHIQPHPTNKTIITFADGEQMKFGKFEDEEEKVSDNQVNKDSNELPVKNQLDKPQSHTIDDTKE